MNRSEIAPKASHDEHIYLDHAASSPLCDAAVDAMQPYILMDGRKPIANANSLHGPGREAFKMLESLRRSFADSICAGRPAEVIFTSGATEADNAAIFGIAKAKAQEMMKMHASKDGQHIRPRVIVSAIEHDAVLNPVRELAHEGFDVTYISPSRQGFVETSALESIMDDDVALVSIQFANSEMGAVQPIRRLVKIAHSHGALFHTDATQALGKVPINVEELGVDAASFSSHKIGGPTGVGALYLKNKTPFREMMFGGGQESGRRSGTQNVLGILGFCAAAEHAVAMLQENALRLGSLRDRVYDAVLAMDGVRSTVNVDTASSNYLPNIVNLLFDGLESETLVLRFDRLGLAVSGASACSSGSLDPSHVLTSMGISQDQARGELRASFGESTTADDVEAFIDAIPKVIDWR